MVADLVFFDDDISYIKPGVTGDDYFETIGLAIKLFFAAAGRGEDQDCQ